MNLPPFSQGADLSLAELTFYQAQSKRWRPPARSLWSLLNGNHVTRSRGHGVHLEELRLYQNGDDIRQIDWRITAKTGKPHTKLYREDKEKQTIFVVDFSDSMRTGSSLLYKSVQAAHFAALLTWISSHNKDRLSTLAVGTKQIIEVATFTPSSAPIHHLSALVKSHRKELSNAVNRQPINTAKLHDALEILARRHTKNAEISIISDFRQNHSRLQQQLKGLSCRNTIRLIHVFDPMEKGQLRSRWPLWLQDFGGVIHTKLNRTIRQELKCDFEEHHHSLVEIAKQIRAPLYSISSGIKLTAQIGGSHE